MAKKKKTSSDSSTVAQNRKAYHNYEVLEEFEAGICLVGTEVKSLRCGKANIADSYAEPKEEELFLINSYIPEYDKAGQFNHKSRRPRKLLLHRREINKLIGKIQTKGMTVVPLSLYFNAKGLAKVKIALVKGKSKYDKREAEKNRDWDRQKSRVLRGDKE